MDSFWTFELFALSAILRLNEKIQLSSNNFDIINNNSADFRVDPHPP